MNELIDAWQGIKALLGFKSAVIAAAFLGSLLACLLCVIYGLLRWNQGRRMRWMPRLLRRGQGGMRGGSRHRPVKKSVRRWRLVR